MTAQPIIMYSAEEYLELERAADYKSEYYRGEIFAMAGAGFNHNAIVSSLQIDIGTSLRGKSCRSLTQDMRIYIPENGLYTYPDLLIFYGKPNFQDDKTDTLLNPSVIIEVQSPSTGEYDRGQKFHLYRSISTLVEYVLIDSRRLSAEAHRKGDNGLWTLVSEAYSIDESIEINHIDLQLQMADIYAQTEGII
ncbi:Uma2 family endonuclease [Dyadobacter sp.]|uniref:Uma2 family endonuclease n=1 Tax=Dyadobacter sp. TaxID=1914288 RepID=UPI003F6FC913